MLTEKGVAYENFLVKNSRLIDTMLSVQADSCELDDPDGLPKPTWDRERQELRVGKTIIKQFNAPAHNQQTILAVFQEEDWPLYVDDPLPRHLEIDPKRRLHDTINSLNRNQKNHLIRFRGNGSGERIRWEFIRQAEFF